MEFRLESTLSKKIFILKTKLLKFFFIATGSNRSEHPLPLEPGKCGRVQLRARLRVLHPQEPHLPRVRDARAEPLRLSQAQQVPAPPPQVHQAHHPAGSHSSAQAETARADSRRSEAGEHHAARSSPPALPGQGDRLWVGVSRQQGCL